MKGSPSPSQAGPRDSRLRIQLGPTGGGRCWAGTGASGPRTFLSPLPASLAQSLSPGSMRIQVRGGRPDLFCFPPVYSTKPQSSSLGFQLPLMTRSEQVSHSSPTSQMHPAPQPLPPILHMITIDTGLKQEGRKFQPSLGKFSDLARTCPKIKNRKRARDSAQCEGPRFNI